MTVNILLERNSSLSSTAKFIDGSWYVPTCLQLVPFPPIFILTYFALWLLICKLGPLKGGHIKRLNKSSWLVHPWSGRRWQTQICSSIRPCILLARRWTHSKWRRCRWHTCEQMATWTSWGQERIRQVRCSCASCSWWKWNVGIGWVEVWNIWAFHLQPKAMRQGNISPYNGGSYSYTSYLFARKLIHFFTVFLIPFAIHSSLNINLVPARAFLCSSNSHESRAICDKLRSITVRDAV